MLNHQRILDEVLEKRREAVTNALERTQVEYLLIGDSKHAYWLSGKSIGSYITVDRNGKVAALTTSTLDKIRGLQRIGVDGGVYTADLIRFGLSGLEPYDLSNDLYRIQAVKDPLEGACIQRACELTATVWHHIRDQVTHSSPSQISELIRKLCLEFNHSKLAFDPSIAVDSDTLKSWTPSSKTIPAGPKIISVDFGICYRGYGSDFARTVITPEADGKIMDSYQKLRECQEQIISICKAGMTGGELVEAAKSLLADCGLKLAEDRYLGHGVGLHPHSYPLIHQSSTHPLEENMFLAIEPSTIVDDVYRIQIEDVVRVTRDGGIRLTSIA